MHLVYFDESGNTGLNLVDDSQPVFVLGALLVPSVQWQIIEQDLNEARRSVFPDPVPDSFEVHGAELISPGKSSFFRGKPVGQRLEIYQAWMDIARRHSLRFFSRAIVKKRYARWLQEAFGPGVLINPHIAAFALLAQVINQFLATMSPPSLGILISDENKEVIRDIEKSIRALRFDVGNLRLGQIIEKGFFIESHQSLLLQLCDLCTFSVRKREEEKIGRPLSSAASVVAELADPLIQRGQESMPDVLAWFEGQFKTEGAARGYASGTEKGPNHTGR